MSNDQEGPLSEEPPMDGTNLAGATPKRDSSCSYNSINSNTDGHSRRKSKILLEGVEYDLSNLLLGGPGADNNDSDDMDIKDNGGGQDDDDEDEDSEDSTSGYLTCQSKATRGTMSRNISNASSVFEYKDMKTVFEQRARASNHQQSPYRFDVEAMRLVMTSFRGIPELRDSFRLTNKGRIVMDEDEDFSLDISHNHNNKKKKEEEEDDEEEDNLLLFANSNSSKATTTNNINLSAKETIANTNASTTPTSTTLSSHASTTNCSDHSHSHSSLNHDHQPVNTVDNVPSEQQHVPQDESIQPEQQQDQKQPDEKEDEELDTGIDDLVYDEATGTYVYRDYEYTYPEPTAPATTGLATEPEPEQLEYHDACQTTREQQQHRFTSLEEIAANVELCRDDYDDEEEHEMEISPGVYVPFRGAKETWQAVATKTTHELDCFDCGIPLVCINDCEFTVCPDCRVVNPVFCEDPIDRPFGVGMGFKKEWVIKKQQHLQQKRLEQERQEPAMVTSRLPSRIPSKNRHRTKI